MKGQSGLTERRVTGRVSLPSQRIRSSAARLVAFVLVAVTTAGTYRLQNKPSPEAFNDEDAIHALFPTVPTVNGHSNVRAQVLEGVAHRDRIAIGHSVQFIASIIQETRVKPSDAMMLALAIVKECRKSDYDPLFVAAVIKAESTFRSHVISNRGALGLMQILPTTGKYISQKREITWQGAHQLHDPEYNIRLGIQYLKYLDKMFKGNKEKVLVAYNWGPGNLLDAVKNNRRIPSGPLTYAKKILTHHASWRHSYRTQLAMIDSGHRFG